MQEVLAQNYTGMLIVIGADTMVVLDGKIFGKPRSLSDAKHMLRQLSGRTHEVITAVSVWMIAAPAAEDISLDDALKLYEEAVKLGLSACDLSEQDLDAFLATEEEGESSPVEEGGASTAPTGSTDTTSSADAPAPGEA